MTETSTSEWTVERLCQVDELAGVLAVEEASYNNPWTFAMFSQELERPEMAYIFVVRGATSGGGAPSRPGETGYIAGYCSIWLVRGEVHINNLAVGPAWRRRGAARALLRRVLSEGQRLGAQRATLEVRRSNNVSRQLYAAAGFEMSGVRPRYYTHPTEDALVLWCRLETVRTV